ncbi:MAG: response regulator transcription factor [Gammaproteobacteria bacterium]|nr:response regulator transcription factor [Gammaproteobacteria bacterium]
MIKVLVVSDIQIHCQGLQKLLQAFKFIDQVSVAYSLEQAVTEISLLIPDVVLLDSATPDSNSLLQHLLKNHPAVKIITLSFFESKNTDVSDGVIACIGKDTSLDELINIIVGTGHDRIPYRVPKMPGCAEIPVQTEVVGVNESRLPVYDYLFDNLTNREQQIVGLLAEGYSNKQISSDLHIELATVKNHLHNIFVKLEVKSRTQAVLRLKQPRYYHQSSMLLAQEM